MSSSYDEPAARATYAKTRDLPGGNSNASFHGALKRRPCQRGEIGEPQVLVVRVGESFGVEALPRILAQLAPPGGVALLPFGDQIAIRAKICAELFSRRRHRVLVSRIVGRCAHAGKT